MRPLCDMSTLLQSAAAACLLAFLAIGPAAAQKPASPAPDPTVVEAKHRSALMSREVPYRVVLPRGYDSAAGRSRRWPVVYLLHGLSGHYDNWTNKNPGGLVTDDFIIVTPEGGDGWYTDSATVPSDRYESYLMQELIPEIDARYRTISERRGRAVAGLSMGGYGSIKFGLKYPDRFYMVGSFSGALDAPTRAQASKSLRPSLDSVYGPADSETRWRNDIFWIADLMAPDDIAKLPFIYIDCGTEDPFFGINDGFSELLLRKKIPHEFRQLPGRHEWPYWNVQVHEFLDLAVRKLALSK